MTFRRAPFRCLVAVTLSILTASSVSSHQFASASTQSILFETQTISGDALKNNPFAAKILSEIEYSKKQIAQLEQDQKNRELNQKLIEQQRIIAKQLEDQALQMLQLQTQTNSSENAFQRFVATVPNNNTKQIFLGEFNFMQKRVEAGHLAMKQVLANGGTWEEAMQAFSHYAGIKRTEMISLNRYLNVQYGFADPSVQVAFNQYGLLPDDYVKVPDKVVSHSGT
jgi:hypothetical protein